MDGGCPPGWSSLAPLPCLRLPGCRPGGRAGCRVCAGCAAPSGRCALRTGAGSGRRGVRLGRGRSGPPARLTSRPSWCSTLRCRPRRRSWSTSGGGRSWQPFGALGLPDRVELLCFGPAGGGLHIPGVDQRHVQTRRLQQVEPGPPVTDVASRVTFSICSATRYRASSKIVVASTVHTLVRRFPGREGCGSRVQEGLRMAPSAVDPRSAASLAQVRAILTEVTRIPPGAERGTGGFGGLVLVRWRMRWSYAPPAWVAVFPCRH